MAHAGGGTGITDDERQLRAAMVATCRAMDARGINQGTAVNLSVRHGARFLITPSSLPDDTMQPEDIVEMGWDGSYVGRRPLSEWLFHRIVRKARADMQVVLHGHSADATSVACHHRTIPAFHDMVGVMGGSTLREPPMLSEDEMARVIAQMMRMSFGMGPEEDGANDVARPRKA